MGANLCSAGHSNSEGSNDDAPITRSSSSNELIKPSSLKPKREQFQASDDDKRVSKATLEDWLLSSPGVKPECIVGGELHVFRHFSRKLHPSSARVHAEAPASSSRPSDSLTSEVFADSIRTSTQSGKLKKKVSFRLPEEADIIILYSPENSFRHQKS